MTEIDSRVIDSLRFPMAVLVVAIHSYIAIDGWSYEAVPIQGLGSNVAQFFIISISHVLAHIAVPTFFLISGYLFYCNFGDEFFLGWKKKIKNRVKSLLIPYILWIFFYIIFLVLLDISEIRQLGIIDWLKSHGGQKMFWCSEKWNVDRVDLWGNPAVSSSPILMPFWYLRDLIVCLLCTPLFYFLLRKRMTPYLMIICVSILSLLYFTQTSFYVPGFSSLSLFFFGFGAALSLWNKSMVELLSRGKYIVWPTFILLFTIEVALDGHNTVLGNIIYPFYIIVGVISVIALSPRTGGGKFTFFIFAAHVFVLPIVGAIVSRVLVIITGATNVSNMDFADKYPILLILEYVTQIGLTVLICMGIYSLLYKYLPRLTKILCGR